MRIFYASGSTPNAAFSSNLWRNNLYLSLVDLGHEVIEFVYDYGDTFCNLDPGVPEQREFIKRNRPLLSAELMRQITAVDKIRPIDIFFSYFYDACITTSTIDAIRELGITTVNWYCNGSYQLHLVKEIAPHYDWCLVPEKFRINDYLSMGARPIYCQEAANPNIYKPYGLPKEFDVTFIGQAYGDRPAYIRFLRSQGIDIRVWGSGWGAYSRTTYLGQHHGICKRLKAGLRTWLLGNRFASTSKAPVVLPDACIGSVLSDEEMIATFSRSKINLGFSSCGNTHASGERILQVRLRDFEVPMSGGFYMVEYMKELEEFFQVDKEIVCYRSAEELADKIKYYLGHDDAREAIRLAGYERCQHDHTWKRRFQDVFKKMGYS